MHRKEDSETVAVVRHASAITACRILSTVFKHGLLRKGSNNDKIHATSTITTTTTNRQHRHGTINDLARLLQDLGFRTSMVLSPKPALSVYKDSLTQSITDRSVNSETTNEEDDDQSTIENQVRLFFVVLFGMHPHQKDMEELYASTFKHVWCLLLFCSRLQELEKRTVSKSHNHNDEAHDGYNNDESCMLQNLLIESLDELARLSNSPVMLSSLSSSQQKPLDTPDFASRRLKTLLDLAELLLQFPRHLLDREYERICTQNATLSNAFLQLLRNRAIRRSGDDLSLECGGWNVTRIDFHPSTLTAFERFKVYVAPAPEQQIKTTTATTLLLPCLHSIVTRGLHDTARNMVETFWSYLLLHLRYFATRQLRDMTSPHLHQFFISGLVESYCTNHNNHNNCTSISLYVHVILLEPD
jgi:hypothetical protein